MPDETPERAEPPHTVTIRYAAKLPNGEVLDSSENRGPLTFALGRGQVIPGVERAVQGMRPGESKTVDVPAEEAYGNPREDLVIEVAKERLAPAVEPKVGQWLEIRQADGTNAMPVQVKEVFEESVVLDGNHPLAGKDLVYEIELLEILGVGDAAAEGAPGS